jgi:hypothetical protein
MVLEPDALPVCPPFTPMLKWPPRAYSQLQLKLPTGLAHAAPETGARSNWRRRSCPRRPRDGGEEQLEKTVLPTPPPRRRRGAIGEDGLAHAAPEMGARSNWRRRSCPRRPRDGGEEQLEKTVLPTPPPRRRLGAIRENSLARPAPETGVRRNHQGAGSTLSL